MFLYCFVVNNKKPYSISPFPDWNIMQYMSSVWTPTQYIAEDDFLETTLSAISSSICNDWSENPPALL